MPDQFIQKEIMTSKEANMNIHHILAQKMTLTLYYVDENPFNPYRRDCRHHLKALYT